MPLDSLVYLRTVCMFNVNMVVGYDLKTKEVVGQVQCPAPNDVCLNEDGTKMWAGCGSRMGKVVIGGGAGTIYEATTKPPFHSTKVLDRGQGTMAGIAEKGGIVYCRVEILTHLRRNRRVDGVGCLKFDFRTGTLRPLVVVLGAEVCAES